VRTLPATMIRLLSPFAPLFSERVFRHAQVLLSGAILAPGTRTVSSALRAMGLSQQKRFHCYHRVLSRASWSSVEAQAASYCDHWWRRLYLKVLWLWASMRR
jgi:hypothetical protein